MKKVRKKVMVVLGILLAVIGLIIVWFNISYSPTKKAFSRDVERIISENRLQTEGEVFTAEDFAGLPAAVQRYLDGCGYIGAPKMSYMEIDFRDVAFMQGRNGPALTIDYTQFNFAAEPARMALIDSSMFGVPFEGCDYYSGGVGGMKGVIAKGITLFDRTGADMDKACLATFLAESMFLPSALVQDYISFEEVNDREVRATVIYAGQTASGVFTFNEQDEMVSFVTEDRAATGTDGTMEYIPWTARCSEYALSENGIKQPTLLQAVWDYPDGDFVYFDGRIIGIEYI